MVGKRAALLGLVLMMVPVGGAIAGDRDHAPRRWDPPHHRHYDKPRPPWADRFGHTAYDYRRDYRRDHYGRPLAYSHRRPDGSVVLRDQFGRPYVYYR